MVHSGSAGASAKASKSPILTAASGLDVLLQVLQHAILDSHLWPHWPYMAANQSTGQRALRHALAVPSSQCSRAGPTYILHEPLQPSGASLTSVRARAVCSGPSPDSLAMMACRTRCMLRARQHRARLAAPAPKYIWDAQASCSAARRAREDSTPQVKRSARYQQLLAGCTTR